jgi:phage FluMu protein Com
MSNTKLTVIPVSDKNDTVLHFSQNPGFLDAGSDNMACGSCGDILVKGAGPAQLAKKFKAEHRLVLDCAKCKSLNVVPTA